MACVFLKRCMFTIWNRILYIRSNYIRSNVIIYSRVLYPIWSVSDRTDINLILQLWICLFVLVFAGQKKKKSNLIMDLIHLLKVKINICYEYWYIWIYSEHLILWVFFCAIFLCSYLFIFATSCRIDSFLYSSYFFPFLYVKP